MNALTLASVLALGFSAVAHAGEGGVRVSVSRFDQEANHIYENCRGWAIDQQDQLRTEMERELSERGMRVLERRDIRAIYSDEYELPNLDPGSVQKRGHFLSAQYTVTGGITELGICEDSSGTAVQLGGLISVLGGPSGADLKVGNHSTVSKVKVVANLVSVGTGEILKTFSARSEITDEGYSVRGGVDGIGAAHGERKAPPIEKAANQAIRDLAGQIAAYLAQK